MWGTNGDEPSQNLLPDSAFESEPKCPRMGRLEGMEVFRDAALLMTGGVMAGLNFWDNWWSSSALISSTGTSHLHKEIAGVAIRINPEDRRTTDLRRVLVQAQTQSPSHR